MLLVTNYKQMLHCMWKPAIWFAVQSNGSILYGAQHWVKMFWSESSLVIIDRSIISLNTYEEKKHQRYRLIFNICLFDNFKQIAQKSNWNKKIRRKEYDWHPPSEKGYSWNQPIHSSSSILKFMPIPVKLSSNNSISLWL